MEKIVNKFLIDNRINQALAEPILDILYKYKPDEEVFAVELFDYLEPGGVQQLLYDLYDAGYLEVRFYSHCWDCGVSVGEPVYELASLGFLRDNVCPVCDKKLTNVLDDSIVIYFMKG